MSPDEDRPLSSADRGGPLQDFLAFCEAELERRRDTGEQFDEAAYKEAMDLVVRKFQALEVEMGP